MLATAWLGCSRQPKTMADWTMSPSPVAIRERISANFAGLQTLKGQATLSVETPEASYIANARIWFRRPDTVAIKVEASFGIDVGSLFAAADRFVLYLPRENICYTGFTSSLPLETFLSFPISYEELMHLLFGEEQPVEMKPFHATSKNQEWLLSGSWDARAYQYRFVADKGVVAEAKAWDQDGSLLWTKTFTRFVKKKRVVLPQSIRLEQPGEHRAIGLFYHTLTLNDQLIMKNIAGRIPANAQRIEWEE